MDDENKFQSEVDSLDFAERNIRAASIDLALVLKFQSDVFGSDKLPIHHILRVRTQAEKMRSAADEIKYIKDEILKIGNGEYDENIR